MRGRVWGVVVVAVLAIVSAAVPVLANPGSFLDVTFEFFLPPGWKKPQQDFNNNTLVTTNDRGTAVMVAVVDYTDLDLHLWFDAKSAGLARMRRVVSDATERHQRSNGDMIYLRSVSGVSELTEGKVGYMMFAGVDSGRKKLLLGIVANSREEFSNHFASFMQTLESSTLDWSPVF